MIETSAVCGLRRYLDIWNSYCFCSEPCVGVEAKMTTESTRSPAPIAGPGHTGIQLYLSFQFLIYETGNNSLKDGRAALRK